MGTHQKLNYIHIFRAIAIIIIVAGHCFHSNQAILESLNLAILKDGTVLFVFIAGFLFEYLSDNFSYGSYLKKKFFNVVSPYLLTSVVGIGYVFLCPRLNPFLGVNKIVQIGMFLTTGYAHNLPTWYIPMTCIFFLSAAVLLKLEKKIIFHKYSLLFFTLPVLLLFSCLVPRLENSFFVKPGMSAWQAYGGYLAKTIFNTILFFPVYILGMFIAHARSNIQMLYQKRIWLWFLLIGSSIVSCLCFYYHLLPGRLLFPKIILTLLVLGYLEHYDENIMKYPRLNGALGVVATYSFSIFFFHYYLIKGVHLILGKALHYSTTYLAAESFHSGYWLIYTGVTFLISFFGSLFVAMLLKKTLEKLGIKHTRYFIGT